MPTFNGDLPDEIARKAVPTQAIVGRLHEDTTIADFTSALVGSGIEDARIHILRGFEGAEVLGDLGTPLGRLIGPARQEPIELLRNGTRLVAVFGVAEADQEQAVKAVVDAGASVMHRFGKWTYT